MKNWSEVKDPILFYDQNFRQQIKLKLKEKMTEIKNVSQACKQTKKPLYIRKLQRQLKENLQQIGEE